MHTPSDDSMEGGRCFREASPARISRTIVADDPRYHPTPPRAAGEQPEALVTLGPAKSWACFFATGGKNKELRLFHEFPPPAEIAESFATTNAPTQRGGKMDGGRARFSPSARSVAVVGRTQTVRDSCACARQTSTLHPPSGERAPAC